MEPCGTLDVQSGAPQSNGKVDGGAQQGNGRADYGGEAEQNDDRGLQRLPPKSDYGQKSYSEFSTFSGEDGAQTLGAA